MKLRVTAVVLTAIVIGCILLFGMTKADIIEAVHAQYGVDFNDDGKADAMHDCWLLGSPQDSTEVEEEPVPGGPPVKKPGIHRFENVILQFPAGTLPPEIAAWHQRVLQGRLDAHNSVLIILGQEEEEKSTFNVFECWPSALRRFRQARVGFRGSVVDEVEIVVGRNELVLPVNPDGK
jgi:hypothetical protein